MPSSRQPPSRRSHLADAAAPQVTLAQALEKAITALRAERIEEAEPALEAVLARWPEQPDALHFLGVLRHTQGRADEAVELIRRAIAIAPGAPGIWNNLGNVLIEAGRVDEAVGAYERAAEIAGKNAEGAGPLNNLALIHRRQSRLTQAEACLRRAIELDP
jgi:Tfp pilus assembly protein PilF